MKLIEKLFTCQGRNDTIEIYPIGDVHLGAKNCAEKPLAKVIKQIQDNPNAYWFGGGDILDAIKPMDKRFDFHGLPNWMVEGDAMTVKERLSDILQQQVDRFVELFEPIRDKCIGLIEGNHEYSIRHWYNTNVLKAMCDVMDCPDLTDEFVARFKFKRFTVVTTLFLYASHGWGSGRTRGAEPNKLGTVMDEWELADCVLRGHSHSYCILAPKPVMELSPSGALPVELEQRYRWAANWGCWLYSHSCGQSTYESRAGYPAKPMMSCKVVITPFNTIYKKGKDINAPKIEIRSITL